DFNGDGKADLAVAIDRDNLVNIFLGNGDGTFQSHVDYATGTDPLSVAVADFNGDGKTDLVLANAADSTVGILLGNGNGSFQTYVDYRTGAEPFWVAVGDFNGDGKMDLVTANVGNAGNTVSVLLGNGDGTFQPHVDYLTGSFPNSVAVGDFNRDGRKDLAVANSQSNTVR